MAGKIIEQAPAPEETAPEVIESKADKFRRLANKRTTVARDKIRLIGNLSVRAIYEYQPEQVEKIIAVLRADIDALELEFAPKAASRERVFEL